MDFLGIPNLDVFVLHKPRRTKGNWTKVGIDERLRMTTATGKWLKLEIRANNFMFDVKNVKNQIKVRLINEDGEEFQRYYLEEWKIYEFVVEIELKLFQTGSSLQFEIITTTTEGRVVHGFSQRFDSKNSGAIRSDGKSSQTTSPNKSTSPSMHSIPSFDNTFDSDIFHPHQDNKEVNGNLEVVGTLKAFEFSQLSDLRLKTNISDITDALNIISSLQGKTYQWKDGELEETGGKRVIGLIAQEVKRVVPQVVHEDPETGILSVSYAELTPILIEAFKDYLKDYKNNQKDVKTTLKSLQEKLDSMIEAQGKSEPAIVQEKPMETLEIEEGPSTSLISHPKSPKLHKLFLLCKAGLFGSIFTFVLSLLLVGMSETFKFSFDHHEGNRPPDGFNHSQSFNNTQPFNHTFENMNSTKPPMKHELSTDMIISLVGSIGILISVIGSIICSIFLCSRKDDIEVTTVPDNRGVMYI